jgi:hypothetical protein
MKRSQPTLRNICSISCSNATKQIETERFRAQANNNVDCVAVYPVASERNNNDVLDGGLLFEVTEDCAGTNTSMPCARMSLNGITVRLGAGPPENNIQKLYKKIRYLGPSIKDVLSCADGTPNSDSPVAAVGGYMGITNTGNAEIHAGDLLAWKLPSIKDQQPRPSGQHFVPLNRKVLEVFPVRSTTDILDPEIYDKIVEKYELDLHATDLIADNAKKAEEVKKCTIGMALLISSAMSSRIVGVSQQHGKRGEKVGVMISPPIRSLYNLMSF